MKGKWWRFDDETVTEMPDGPAGEAGDHGSTAATVAKKKKQASDLSSAEVASLSITIQNKYVLCFSLLHCVARQKDDSTFLCMALGSLGCCKIESVAGKNQVEGSWFCLVDACLVNTWED